MLTEEFEGLEIKSRLEYIDSCMDVLASNINSINPRALSHRTHSDIWSIIHENFRSLSGGISSLRNALRLKEDTNDNE